MTDRSDRNVRYDRDLLLHGRKRNEVLSLDEVSQYGTDSFGDPNYVTVYGITPPQWYARGIRMLGRTAVECTRDELADLIGRDIADLAERMPSHRTPIVIDPFAGSCNTLFWTMQHLPDARGVAIEMDPQVHELSARNVALLGTRIELQIGNYERLLPSLNISRDSNIVAFIAPPWGKALSETTGLDLRGTVPPIADIIRFLDRCFPMHQLLLAVQVYERVDPVSLSEVQRMLEWSELRAYALNVGGENHGLLLGALHWRP